MPTILVTSRSFGSGDLDVAGDLVRAGHEVVRGPATHDLGELRDALRPAQAWIAGTGPVTAAHLDAAPDLRIVARYGVGADAVDLTAARERRIVVTNTPGANSDAVADHAVALLMAALRGVVSGDRRVRTGDWRVERAREVSALSVGLVGFGRIGRGVAHRLAALGAQVSASDPYVSDADLQASGITSGTGRIPEAVDVVSLHAPGPDCIVDGDWVDRARPGLILVNTARGSLVDESAVAEGLRSGRLRAYATDALRHEGGVPGGPLLDPAIADRVVLTPHSGAQTVEAIDRMGAMAVESVLDVLAGRRARYALTEGT